MERVTAGYVYGKTVIFASCSLLATIFLIGDSTSGQRAVYEVGLTGIPVFNVNNNCSTGSTALILAKEFVEYGQADCVLAVGFEKMEKGSLTSKVRNIRATF